LKINFILLVFLQSSSHLKINLAFDSICQQQTDTIKRCQCRSWSEASIHSSWL